MPPLSKCYKKNLFYPLPGEKPTVVLLVCNFSHCNESINLTLSHCRFLIPGGFRLTGVGLLKESKCHKTLIIGEYGWIKCIQEFPLLFL